MSKTSLLVIHDPFCGWCYGAKPLPRAVADSGVMPVSFVHRALFAEDNAMVNSPALSEKIRQFDARIAAMAGVPFSDVYRARLLDEPGLRHDSWFTALAVQMVRREAPEREHDLLDLMQESRFVSGPISVTRRFLRAFSPVLASRVIWMTLSWQTRHRPRKSVA